MSASPFPFTIPDREAGQRIDRVLATAFPQVSRSRWAKILEAGQLTVDGKAIDASYRVKAGMVIEHQGAELSLDGEAPSTAAVSSEPVAYTGLEPTVLYEDAELVVVSKPVGLAVHPGNGLSPGTTLSEWLEATGRVRPGATTADAADDEVDADDIEGWADDQVAASRIGIVHRLDRVTSGVLVAAKTPTAHARLAAQFADRSAGRLYWAVVSGRVGDLFDRRPAGLENLLRKVPPAIAVKLRRDKATWASIASFLERDPRERTRFRVSPTGEGRRAITHVAEISAATPYSIVECKLETGRTHQIRVHLASIGLPILGDGMYGGHAHQRCWLHAHELTFTHPKTGKTMTFEAPWPAADAAWIASVSLTAGTRKDLWDGLKSLSPKDGLED